jgi:hypothetical protein
MFFTRSLQQTKLLYEEQIDELNQRIVDLNKHFRNAELQQMK